MSKKLQAAGLILIVSLFLYTACSPKQATTNPDIVYTAAAQTVEAQLTGVVQAQNPTTDVNQIYTQAAETMEVQLTATAIAANLTAPTSNQGVPTLGLTASVIPSGGTPGQPVVTLTPFSISTFTPTHLVPSSASDKYELLDQNPDDNSEIAKQTKFDMQWTLKNTGTTTWTTLYTIEWFMGDRISGGAYDGKNRYYFPAEVAPGDSVTVFVDMKTPNTSGTYYSWWKLKNELGANFGDVDVTIIVP
jgi:hypothetical protein